MVASSTEFRSLEDAAAEAASMATRDDDKEEASLSADTCELLSSSEEAADVEDLDMTSKLPVDEV